MAFDADTVKPLIVERIAAGEFVEDIAATDGMPSPATIYRWQAEDPAFESQCAQARARSAPLFERRVVKLADKVERGDIDPKAASAAGNLLTWVAKVRNRKVYGDKVDADLTVNVGDAVLERLARARGEKAAA